MKKFLFLTITSLVVSPLLGETFAWDSPTRISTLGVNASSPFIQIDSSGNADAAWIESDLVTVSHLPQGRKLERPSNHFWIWSLFSEICR